MSARTAVAALALSATALVAIVASEGYTDSAVVPVKNDRPTMGYGSTFHEDGRPVKMGDTTTPVRALVLAQKHISKDEAAFRKCAGGILLHQHEYDAIMEWVYNVGPLAACSSTLMKKLSAGDYSGACNELRRWTFAGGREVRGLVLRRERERLRCLGRSTADNPPQGGE